MKDIINNNSFSQLGQDKWVMEVLNNKQNGVFVDVGAVDGIQLSNTYSLETNSNWTGLCVEPSKQYQKLIENRKCLTDKRAVYNENGKMVKFLEVHSRDPFNMFSGIDESLDDYTRAGEFYNVKTVTLDSLLKEHNLVPGIDYLSIDTEGSEWEIIKDFPFSKWKIKLITIEHNMVEPQRSQIFQLLSSYGYLRDFTANTRWDDWYYHVSCVMENPDYFLKKQREFRDESDQATLAEMKLNN